MHTKIVLIAILFCAAVVFAGLPEETEAQETMNNLDDEFERDNNDALKEILQEDELESKVIP